AAVVDARFGEDAAQVLGGRGGAGLGCAHQIEPGLDDPPPVGDAALLGAERAAVGPQPVQGQVGERRAALRHCAEAARVGGGSIGHVTLRNRQGPGSAEIGGCLSPPSPPSPARRRRTPPYAGAVPPAESRTALVRRARRIARTLAAAYPDAHCELTFHSPLELLVATILSAQCTDKRVNEVTPTLFARYRSAADYAAADRAELEDLIRSTGFFRAKTDSLQKLGQALVERHD